MTYIDGMIAPVAKDKKAAYLDHARKAGEIFKEYGALGIVECWGDDVPDGKLTSLPMAVKLEPGETVVLSWITWPDKATRDEGMKKVMEDARMHSKEMAMPFDGKRMIFGGFEKISEM